MIGESHDGKADILVLPEAEREGIIRHLQSALPNEGVGLLAVAWTEREGRRIAETRRFYPGANVRASPVRFELDPVELVSAMRDIDRNGWALGAIVHSHPHGPARPSRTDLAEAWYPESLIVIASFAGEQPDLRAWRLERVEEEWVPRRAQILDRLP